MPAATAEASVPEFDNHDGRSLPAELRWAWRNVLTRRRRRQGFFVLALMLLGGVTELMTLGAVVPLLALFVSNAGSSTNRVTELLSHLGINLADYSLAMISIIFCAVAVITGAVRILLAWVGQRYVYAIRCDVGVLLYDRMLHQPYSFHVGINSSRIINTLESVPGLATGMLMPLLQSTTAIVIGIFVVGGLIMLSPFATLVAVFGFGLIYGGMSLTAGRKLRKNAQLIGRMAHRALQTVQEGLGGIGDVLLDNTQSVYVRKFAKIDAQLSDAQGDNALIAVTPRFVAEAVGIILMVMLAMILHGQPGGAGASLPMLGALALGAQRLLPLMQQSYFGWATLLSRRALFFDTITLLRLPGPAIPDPEPLRPLQSAVELDSVSFAYPSDRKFTLNDISLQIQKGSRVGFVGKTGSGKTTLLNLVMGLLDPGSGEIRVDGRALTPANKQSWQKQVAHVPQSIFMMDGSIAENVALGIPPEDIDEDKLRHVCRQADLAQFIESLPRAYLTPVGERGVRLSGGQIQRIGLARALYKDATVLILDEATSSLDDATEANIIEAVQRLGRQFTVLMIAHRTTTLRECDLIYKLDSGRLVESGSPEDVLGAEVAGFKSAATGGRIRTMPKSRYS